MSQIPETQVTDVKPLTLRDFMTQLEAFETQFKQSVNAQSPSLLQYFEQRQKHNIQRCICLGLGTFTSIGQDSSTKNPTNRSLHQLAILRVLIEGLTKEREIDGESKISVYFQDPAFTELDELYLHCLGYKVIKDPAAIQKISTSTLLFAPCVSHEVVAEAVKNKMPVVYIGNDLDRAIENVGRDGRGNALPGRDEHVRALERFKRAITATQRVPVFGKDEQGKERDATVYWLDPDRE